MCRHAQTQTKPFHLLDLFLSLSVDDILTAANHVHNHTDRQPEEACISRVRPVRACREGAGLGQCYSDNVVPVLESWSFGEREQQNRAEACTPALPMST
jgi:hypothetical protein